MVLKYLLVLALIYAVIFGTLSVFVYKDGKRTGIHGPGKWAAFVFFTGGTGFLLYLSESDNAVHEFDEADPYSLPGAANAGSRSSGRETDEPE